MSTPLSPAHVRSDPMEGLWPRLLDNASWLFTGAAARSVLGFAVSVYLARVLGPEMFGRVGFAMAVLAYFVLLTDGGLQALGTREVAAERGTVGKLAGRVLVIRGVLTALSLLVIALPVGIGSTLLARRADQHRAESLADSAPRHLWCLPGHIDLSGAAALLRGAGLFQKRHPCSAAAQSELEGPGCRPGDGPVSFPAG
jgi:hypothetical protein